MKMLLKQYHSLKANIKDIQQTIFLIEANDPLPFRGRGRSEVQMWEVLTYLYCLLEEMEIQICSVKNLIVAKVLEVKEKYIEFRPYKFAGETTDNIQNTMFGLYQYQDHWYLISGNVNPKIKQCLVFIYNDLTVAIDAFYTECQSYINIRKTVDPIPMEFNIVPIYAEIVKHFVQRIN